MFAEELIAASGLAQHYVATGRAWDSEMEHRIATHRERRGRYWKTHEAPLALSETIASIDNANNAVLVDCLTLWITNLMMAEHNIDAAFEELLARAARSKARLIFVSNEVGMGIVPENAMAREFRDHAGRLHQQIAAIAAEVYFVAAGLPLKMKG